MRALVIIPTYNERESLPLALERTRKAVPDADVLVADDNSPDGTGAVADGSHRPEQLPDLLARAAAADAPDLVIGSRWVPGGEVVNWPVHRELLSRGANTYVQLLLGLPVRDATAGFRVFRAPALAALPLEEIESQGYCFQVDMTWRVHRAGGRVAEVPISFVERAEGVSKMSRGIIAEALVRTTAWGVRHRARQLIGLLRRR